MKVLVAVKQVVDHNVNVRVKSDGSGVETANVKMSINPFDEIAVEEAVQLKEKGDVSDIAVVTIGPKADESVLRTALAMGADRAIHIESDQTIEALGIAKLLAEVAKKESPDLLLLGKQTIDNDDNQVPQMLAALLDMPQGTYINHVEFADGKAKVAREIDGGIEHLELSLPCVLSTDLRLNEPRYIKMPNIMQARRKPLETIAVAELGVDIAKRSNVEKVVEPPKRSAGVIVADVAELVDKLKNEAKVI